MSGKAPLPNSSAERFTILLKHHRCLVAGGSTLTTAPPGAKSSLRRLAASVTRFFISTDNLRVNYYYASAGDTPMKYLSLDAAQLEDTTGSSETTNNKGQ